MNSSFKIAIGGDLIPSGANIKLYEEGDAEKIFSQEVVDIFVNADFSIVNLEGALTDSDTKQRKIGPNIKASLATVQGIRRLGVKAAALANNHITDYGDKGYADTISILAENGITYLGAGPDKLRIKTHVSVQTPGGGNLCVYNVSETFFNVPDDHHAGVNVYDEWTVLNEIKKLKTAHDYLIVIYHGGAENFQYPTPQTRKRFHRMAECGADLITAQHTHCIGCEEFYGDSYLLYGQGNFSFPLMHKGINREGIVLEVVFDGKAIIKKHRIEMQDDDCLVYSENQNWDDVSKRSAKINDKEFIVNEYKKNELAQKRFVSRYLHSYKGVSAKLLHKMLPHKLWVKWAKTYSSYQILCNKYAIESDRVREDLFYCWSSMED